MFSFLFILSWILNYLIVCHSNHNACFQDEIACTKYRFHKLCARVGFKYVFVYIIFLYLYSKISKMHAFVFDISSVFEKYLQIQ